MPRQQCINDPIASRHDTTKEASNLYNEADEVVLLREAVADLSDKLLSLSCKIDGAVKRRTYYTVKHDLENIQRYANSAWYTAREYNRPNLYNIKNKETLLEEYIHNKKQREETEQQLLEDFVKQLDEVYPS